jgi:hypothetical protein
VVKLATRTHLIHDATTKLGTSIFQTCFRCELTQSDGRVLVVDVPLKFDLCPSSKAEAESDHVAEVLHIDVGVDVVGQRGAVHVGRGRGAGQGRSRRGLKIYRGAHGGLSGEAA